MRSIAYILALVYLATLAQPMLVILNFYQNRAYIADKFCVNKFKPEKKCHGKCFLKKQLEQSLDTENKDENKPANPTTQIKKFDVHQLAYLFLPKRFESFLKKETPNYSSPHFVAVYGDIVTPPPKFSFFV